MLPCHSIAVPLLVAPEGLLIVGHPEEATDGEDVGPGVHQDEEEYTRGVQSRELRVVLHYSVQRHQFNFLSQNCPKTFSYEHSLFF